MSNSTSREHDLVEMAQRAKDALYLYGNCAQASFAILQEEFDLDHAIILKALGPLPGIAARGETCGAVIGCLMALGLTFGSDLPPAREFCRLFVDEHGSTACRTLLEAKLGRWCDFADPADVAQYVSAGGPQVCAAVVASAVQHAGAIIVSESWFTLRLANGKIVG
jgi:C_GCAxxG_C_C family probable redox protein